VLLDAGDYFGDDLQLLSEGGAKIAIDDFGTGYSSLTSLQRFPVDTVKIDRSFVSGLGVRPRDDAIVNAVIAMGAALDLTVVAEGVETAEQAQQLEELGCQRVQGYLYAKPLSTADFTRLLSAPRSGPAAPLEPDRMGEAWAVPQFRGRRP
jgi:EAL domain-containing protein (putative c-di-GMP-specific phosphodiesterase class I)